MKKELQVRYFAILREERGLSSETVSTVAATARELYGELAQAHRFSMACDRLQVAVNDEFESWDYELKNADTVVFIPPVAGG